MRIRRVTADRHARQQDRNPGRVPATSRDEVGRAELARPHAIDSMPPSPAYSRRHTRVTAPVGFFRGRVRAGVARMVTWRVGLPAVRSDRRRGRRDPRRRAGAGAARVPAPADRQHVHPRLHPELRGRSSRGAGVRRPPRLSVRRARRRCAPSPARYGPLRQGGRSRRGAAGPSRAQHRAGGRGAVTDGAAGGGPGRGDHGDRVRAVAGAHAPPRRRGRLHPRRHVRLHRRLHPGGAGRLGGAPGERILRRAPDRRSSRPCRGWPAPSGARGHGCPSTARSASPTRGPRRRSRSAWA